MISFAGITNPFVLLVLICVTAVGVTYFVATQVYWLLGWLYYHNFEIGAQFFEYFRQGWVVFVFGAGLFLFAADVWRQLQLAWRLSRSKAGLIIASTFSRCADAADHLEVRYLSMKRPIITVLNQLEVGEVEKAVRDFYARKIQQVPLVVQQALACVMPFQDPAEVPPPPYAATSDNAAGTSTGVDACAEDDREPLTVQEAVAGFWNRIGTVHSTVRIAASDEDKTRIPYRVSGDMRTQIDILGTVEIGRGTKHRRYEVHEVFDRTSTNADVASGLPHTFMSVVHGYNVAIITHGSRRSQTVNTLFGDGEGLAHIAAKRFFKWIRHFESSETSCSLSVAMVMATQLRLASLLHDKSEDDWLSTEKMRPVQSFEALRDICSEAQNRFRERTEALTPDGAGDIICKFAFKVGDRVSALWLIDIVDTAADSIPGLTGANRLPRIANPGSHRNTFMANIKHYAVHGRIKERGNRLTSVLDDLFQSKGKLSLISHISLDEDDLPATLSTLGYAAEMTIS